MKDEQARSQFHRDTLKQFRSNRPIQWSEINEEIINYCNQLNQDEVVLLDAGAGEGRYKKILEPVSSLKYIGVDTGVASDEWDFSGVIDADLTNLDFLADCTVDVVILIQVLSHVPDLRAALLEISRVLKPEGAIFCTTQNMQSLTHVPYDFRRLTAYGIAYNFKEVGVDLVTISPLLYGDNVSAIKQTQFAIKNTLQYGESNSIFKRVWLRSMFYIFKGFEIIMRYFDKDFGMPINPIGYYAVLVKSLKINE